MRGAGRQPRRCATRVVAALAIAVATQPAPVLADTGGQVVGRAAITSRGRHHGEVRIVRRGEVAAVQVLLFSKVLGHVIARIHERELENWPAGADGHEASQRYLSALRSAEKSVTRDAERRRALLIEFSLSPKSARVLLAEPRIAARDGALEISASEPIERLELPRSYVRRNLLLIAAEHLGLSESEIEERLALPPVD